MEAKFTKGKWRINPEIQFNEWGTRETFIECDGKHIATVYGDDEEVEANARLIAAAPMMYEALAKIKSMCDGNKDLENSIWHTANKALRSYRQYPRQRNIGNSD